VVKSSGVERESDGVVVLPIAGMNPAGGKGPDFGHAGDGGTRKGMPGTAPANYPQGQHLPPEKVRRLQNRLWAAAKQSSGRRFHALYDRIYRSDVLWEAWERVRENRGAAGLVVLCSSREQAEEAQRRATAILVNLGLSLHPDKTRVVDLREGKEGVDFLGWHFRARMSGKLWERQRIIRYYLHRWPSVRFMKRARARVKAMTGRGQVGMELDAVIKRLNLFLRGWGGYFRTGNSGNKSITMDRYVAWRLTRLLIKKRGRNLRTGQATRWTRTWFHDQGLHKLMGTIRYPKAA
jgi:hypothetical protein